MTRLIIAEKHSVAQAIARHSTRLPSGRTGICNARTRSSPGRKATSSTSLPRSSTRTTIGGAGGWIRCPLTRHLTGNLSSTGRKAPTGNSRPSNSSSNEMT